MATKPDDRVTKRRVTMTNYVFAGNDDDGKPVFMEHKAVDYVRPDFLDAYLADARSNWQSVEVSDEPDAGPAGYDGATYVPDHLDHPLSGQLFPASEQKG
jgi:hypothetical protein